MVNRSDSFKGWVDLSYKIAKKEYGLVVGEVQSLGQLHCHIRVAELSAIEKRETKRAASELELLQFNHTMEISRLWVLAAFSLAYKVERGDVYQKRDVSKFKKLLNPLRNVFEKGYIDGHKDKVCFPEPFLNIDPYRCFGWRVFDRSLSPVEFYRVEIAEALFDALDAEQ